MTLKSNFITDLVRELAEESDNGLMVIDKHSIMLHPKGAYRLVHEIYPFVHDSGADMIAGPIDVILLISGVVLESYIAESRGINGLIVRNEAKKHGTVKVIEGPIVGKRVAVLHFACFNGQKILKTIQTLENAGLKVVKVISLFNYGEGGKEALEHLGYDYSALVEVGQHVAPG